MTNDLGRQHDAAPLGEIFGQLREINDRLARIETTQTLVGQEHERRIVCLEDRPNRMLAAAGTISAIVSGLVAALVWLIGRTDR